MIHRSYDEGYGSLSATSEPSSSLENGIKNDDSSNDSSNDKKYYVRAGLLTMVFAMVLTVAAVTMTINKNDNILNLKSSTDSTDAILIKGTITIVTLY
jgi:hypothetical protein